VQRQHHYSEANHLHFITASTYSRVRLFDSPRFRERFIETLALLRTEFDFRLVGYVLMPEHFHLLVWPGKTYSPSRIVGSLKQRTDRYIIENLKRSKEPWCLRMLDKIVLSETVHDESTYRVWQRRFYDFNVWSELKRLEKLQYMHGNPVKRKLVESAADWPWSSWRFYHLGDSRVLVMDRVP
jgi:REP-associated tyrosine transposase